MTTKFFIMKKTLILSVCLCEAKKLEGISAIRNPVTKLQNNGLGFLSTASFNKL
jgi:hypothetical protein